MMKCKSILILTLLPFFSLRADWPPIPRRIPPPGIEISEDARQQLQDTLNRLARNPNSTMPEVEIFLKAVRFALLHGEFYKKNDTEIAQSLLKEAEARMTDPKRSWTEARGLVVRGYRSSVDGSAQPYGLEIPDQLDQPTPLYVWLHGRGDKVTDLHFIHQRMNRPGKFKIDDAIVLHPFGRQCMGFKSAGEIDVLEAIEDVKAHYHIDPRRIVLMGFSMGGAGCWHIGAHYTDRFVAMSPGAGFSETRRYIRLKEEDYPPVWEQTLWRMYDVPNYTRNLLNLPVVAYSGEKDKQIQAARVMEGAYAEHGKTLNHVIGPDMGHKYDSASMEQILATMKTAVENGLNPLPHEVSFQTRTLRYNRLHWVEVLGLKEHWEDARIDARVDDEGVLHVDTENISRFRLNDLPKLKATSIKLNQGNPIPAGRSFIYELGGAKKKLNKEPGLQGPIDDAFLSSFIVVPPDRSSPHPTIQKWVDFELDHYKERWRTLF
ncbi:MAG: prolyl oligopeptidase family serine peptidase, partial [Verrucomicrobiota bacterium]